MTEENVTDAYIARRFVKYFRVFGGKPFSRSRVEDYATHMGWEIQNWDDLINALKEGADNLIAVSPENDAATFILIEKGNEESPYIGAQPPERKSALGGFPTVAKQEDHMDNTLEAVSEKVPSATTAKGKKNSSRVQKSSKGSTKRRRGGAGEKYRKMAHEILQVLPRGIYLGRSNIVSEAEKNGLNTGNWLTLVKYLQMGTSKLKVTDNGLSGNRKKYMITGGSEATPPAADVATPAPDSTAPGTTITIPSDDKPIVITIKIAIGGE